MSTLKRLTPKQVKKRTLFFGDGLWFGFGFFVAAFISMSLVLPLIICAWFTIITFGLGAISPLFTGG